MMIYSLNKLGFFILDPIKNFLKATGSCIKCERDFAYSLF